MRHTKYVQINGFNEIDAETEEFIKSSDKLALDYHGEEEMVAAYNGFYDQVLEGNSVLVD